VSDSKRVCMCGSQVRECAWELLANVELVLAYMFVNSNNLSRIVLCYKFETLALTIIRGYF
jgi:hypothetical protein